MKLSSVALIRLAVVVACACAEPAPKPSPVQPAAPVDAPPALAEPVPQAPVVTPITLPEPGTHAKQRLLARGSFGRREDQFGRMKNEYAGWGPQSFAPTADGRLLVLDTAKRRLVWYDPAGKLEQVIALPDPRVVATEVAVAKDGTIAVMQEGGLTTLFDAQGKPKRSLHAHRGSLYAVDNDLYMNVDGLSSEQLSNTQGTATGTPRFYRDQNNHIPGHLAPDGTTVLGIGQDEATRTIFVSAMRGAAGDMLWKRLWPGPVGIPFLQADAVGRIYVVINHEASLELVCVDAKTGDAVGMVHIPDTWRSGGEQLRMFSVAPQGGLVYASETQAELRFEWLDCHP
jgi:hypothetical protein